MNRPRSTEYEDQERKKVKLLILLLKDHYKVKRLQNVSGTLWSLHDTNSKNCVHKIIYLINTLNISICEYLSSKKKKEQVGTQKKISYMTYGWAHKPTSYQPITIEIVKWNLYKDIILS
ncbi:hypothetical protein HanRHA438_Chr02g0064211 [Helianthus annuus]|nr:hypothetical protein HanRHA438_Chr02g0064211 [Helianthus annuus]